MIGNEKLTRLDRQRFREKRGTGTGLHYKPWIEIDEFGSKGLCTRLRGNKNKRIHHFMSNLEKEYFYILEFMDSVVDIREQYPLLPIDETMLISKQMNFRHPHDKGLLNVCTSDFLITQKINGKKVEFARTIKPSEELNKKRTIDKFELERRYWEKKDIDWGIVTEKEINHVLAQNIERIRVDYDLSQNLSFVERPMHEIEYLLDALMNRIIGQDRLLKNEFRTFEDQMALDAGAAISLFNHLVIHKRIEVDLNVPLLFDKQQKISLKKNQLNLGAGVL